MHQRGEVGIAGADGKGGDVAALEGKLDPIRGLVSRQLKMKGNMMKVMKAPKAAVELVNSCAKVDTAWLG